MQEFHVFFVLPWRLVHKKESHFKYMKQKETQLVLDSAAGHFEKKKRTNMESTRSLGHLREKGKPLGLYTFVDPLSQFPRVLKW